MKVEQLSGVIGAKISGVDLAAALPSQRADFRRLLEEHLVLFFVDQSLDTAAFKRFGEVIGDLEVTPLAKSLGGPMEAVHTIEAPLDAGRGTYADRWHSDVSFNECPPYASILMPEVLPPIGGDTLWANMYAAYEGLSEPLKSLAESLEVVHSSPPGFAFRESVHPAVRIHPQTKRKALYINSVFSTRIVGVSPAESQKLIDLFCTLATLPDFQVRYRWTADTVAMWDNRFTQHYATRDYNGPRRMQRMTVVGEPVYGIEPVTRPFAVATA